MSKSLIAPGLMVGRYFWGFMGPIVKECGEEIQVSGGWVVPVKYRSGKCGLLRHHTNYNAVSIDSVSEVFPNTANARSLLRRSTRLPEVSKSEDSKVVCLVVYDGSEDSETAYELRLHGIIGNFDGSHADVVVPYRQGAASEDEE